MKVIPVGYGNKLHQRIIEQVMAEDQNALLIDVRKSRRSAVPGGWDGAALRRRFQDRYLPLGHVLGNRNYNNGGPIDIIDLEGGLADLRSLRDFTLLPLCGCVTYEPNATHPEGCHRRTICLALVERWSDVEILQPEEIARTQKAREEKKD